MSTNPTVQAHESAIAMIDAKLVPLQSNLNHFVDSYKHDLDCAVHYSGNGSGHLSGNTQVHIINLVARIEELIDQRRWHENQIIEAAYVPTVDANGRPWFEVAQQS